MALLNLLPGRRQRPAATAPPVGAALAAVLALLSCAAAPAQEGRLEAAVKATYLYKFGPYVEWPANAFQEPAGALNLCVVGEDRLGRVLDEAVAGQEIAGRPIAVHRLPVAAREAGCQVMYIGGSRRQTVAEALEAVRGMPVLTVTDAAQDPAAPGIIHLVLQDNRVRFEIDERKAAEGGIRISSKLLDLAIRVRRRQ